MTMTKLQNMINPEVMADMISAKLPNLLRFSAIAKVDSTLEGVPGNTITIPSYAYIGEADEFAEGEALDTAVLTTSTRKLTIKKAGKAVEITDEAKLSGYGDPIGEAEKQLLMSIVHKVDNDSYKALADAQLKLTVDSVLTPDAISDGIDLFEEEDSETRILFVSPKQVGTLRKDKSFNRASDLGDQTLVTGAIGEIYGCQVVPSKLIKEDEGKFKNYITKEGALTILVKRKPLLETDRDILKKTDVLSIDQHYGVAIADSTKVVELTVNA